MTPDIIRFDGLPVTRWHNDAGRKADIAATDEWQVGFAWLDADAPFSDFTGRDRTITLVDGSGFTLTFSGHPALRVADKFRPSAFDGGWPTQCTLLAGPCLVLNAMTARSRYHHAVTISSADAVAQVAPAADAIVFLVLLAGTATVSMAGDSAVMAPRESVRVVAPVSLHGAPGSCVATITFSPVAASSD